MSYHANPEKWLREAYSSVVAKNEHLKTALEESQARERAAVEDMKTGIEDRGCEVCAKYHTRHECNGCNFVWRGPQEAGNGGAE